MSSNNYVSHRVVNNQPAPPITNAPTTHIPVIDYTTWFTSSAAEEFPTSFNVQGLPKGYLISTFWFFFDTWRYNLTSCVKLAAITV